MIIYEREHNNKYLPLNLKLNYNETQFHISEISFNKKEEFFYRPTYVSKYMITEFENSVILGYTQHVSFHQDGTIHIKYTLKNPKRTKYKEIVKLNNNIFRHVEPSTFSILIIDNIYFSNHKDSNTIIPPIIDINDSNFKNHPIWQMDNKIDFSVFIFITHDTKRAESLLDIPWIKSIAYDYPKQQLILIRGYNQFNLFVLLANRTFEYTTNNYNKKTDRSTIIVPDTNLIQ